MWKHQVIVLQSLLLLVEFLAAVFFRLNPFYHKVHLATGNIFSNGILWKNIFPSDVEVTKKLYYISIFFIFIILLIYYIKFKINCFQAKSLFFDQVSLTLSKDNKINLLVEERLNGEDRVAVHAVLEYYSENSRKNVSHKSKKTAQIMVSYFLSY